MERRKNGLNLKPVNILGRARKIIMQIVTSRFKLTYDKLTHN